MKQTNGMFIKTTTKLTSCDFYHATIDKDIIETETHPKKIGECQCQNVL